MFIYNLKIDGGKALKIIIALLSLFMLVVFGISIYRIFFSSGKFEVSDRFAQNDITEIEAKNYTNILQAVHDNPDEYLGMKIKFSGYVYRLIDFQENEFVLARDMIINEERTQSVIVGFLSQYKNAKKFNNGDWIEVTGVIEMGKYHNKDIPVIKVTNAQIITAPENPYVFLPDDTYIPTSGML